MIRAVLQVGGRRGLTRAFWFSALAYFLTQCGARTELFPGEPAASNLAPPDAGPIDAALDVSDASVDVKSDRELPRGCDAGDESIVLLNQAGELYRFDPWSLATELVGIPNCGAFVFNSMTVARSGRLYLNTSSGDLLTADISTLSCERTPFDPSQVGFGQFGMGFAANDVPAGETLYITPRIDGDFVFRLSSIDLETFRAADIGALTEPLPPAEVKGTGDGRLFLVHVADETRSARLIEIDKDTAQFGDSVELSIGFPWSGFDFAFWGGSFYVFSSVVGEPTAKVTRYSPETGSVEELGRVPVIVVGAGVSTCAPL